MNTLRSLFLFLPFVSNEDPWFPTNEEREVVVDTVETPDGRVFQRTQRKAEFVNFDTGAVELRPVSDVTQPVQVDE